MLENVLLNTPDPSPIPVDPQMRLYSATPTNSEQLRFHVLIQKNYKIFYESCTVQKTGTPLGEPRSQKAYGYQQNKMFLVAHEDIDNVDSSKQYFTPKRNHANPSNVLRNSWNLKL
ncbi:hypothetical protein evm_015146 [Chilo suppressalis]|nr:hypothetical protein evm_015146 [Chilo suppressalis]